MGTRLHQGLKQALGDHKHVGDIRGGKGLLAAVELVEDRGTKAPFGADKKVGPRVLAEMTKRGVITRARLEHIFFAPPLVVTEEQVDRLISVMRDAIKAVTGSSAGRPARAVARARCSGRPARGRSPGPRRAPPDPSRPRSGCGHRPSPGHR